MNIKLIIAAIVATVVLGLGGVSYFQYKALIKQGTELATLKQDLKEAKVIQDGLVQSSIEYSQAIQDLQGRQQIVRNTYVTRVEQIQSKDPTVTVNTLGKDISDATK